jgi:hypothetical protein
VVETQDSLGQYVHGAEDTRYEPNIHYDDEDSPTEGWKVAPHHHRAPDSYYLGRLGRFGDHLAISSVLRDRYFLATCRKCWTTVVQPRLLIEEAEVHLLEEVE